MSEEEKEAIKFLKALKDNYKSQAEAINRSINKDIYQEEYEVYIYRSEQLEKALTLIEKQEKEIDKMAEWIQELMDNTVGKQAIKEIAYKEIENEEQKHTKHK